MPSFKHASLAAIFAFGLVQPAIAGGSTNWGVVSRAKSAVSESAKVFSAVATGVKYSWPDDDDKYHERAAYQWGYEVGNVNTVVAVRTVSEKAQAAVYNYQNFAIFSVSLGQQSYAKYTPTSVAGPGGILDSQKDIDISRMGAADKEAGKPMNPDYEGPIRE